MWFYIYTVSFYVDLFDFGFISEKYFIFIWFFDKTFQITNVWIEHKFIIQINLNNKVGDAAIVNLSQSHGYKDLVYREAKVHKTKTFL